MISRDSTVRILFYSVLFYSNIGAPSDCLNLCAPRVNVNVNVNFNKLIIISSCLVELMVSLAPILLPLYKLTYILNISR